MTDETSTPEQFACHVDHEVSQLLNLHALINGPRFSIFPEVLRRAAYVAYAIHFRVLMEFFHDDRPNKPPNREDITYFKFTGKKRGGWSPKEEKRLVDADKLVGHLSAGRLTREGDYPEWASEEDLGLVRDHIRALLAAKGDLLPRSRKASAIL